KRNPEVVATPVELAHARQHADHRVGLAVEQERSAHNVPGAPHKALPGAVSEYGHLLLTLLVLIGREGTAQSGLHAEYVKVRRRDHTDAQANRLAARFPWQVTHRGATLRSHRFKRAALLCPVDVVCRGDAVAPAARGLLPHLHDAFRLRIAH